MVGIVTDFVPTLRQEDIAQQEVRDVLVPLVELIKDNHDIAINVPEVL